MHIHDTCLEFAPLPTRTTSTIELRDQHSLDFATTRRLLVAVEAEHPPSTFMLVEQREQSEKNIMLGHQVGMNRRRLVTDRFSKSSGLYSDSESSERRTGVKEEEKIGDGI